MGNWWSAAVYPQPSPPMVLVAPVFDFPPLASRTRMLESSYNLLFGKLALRCLFEDYFVEAKHFSAWIMLKPIDDPHVDLIATVAGPVDHKPEKNIVGNAQFRWQSDVDDSHTFIDIFVSNTEQSCAYYPEYGFGAFEIFPLLLKQRVSSEDYGVIGLRWLFESFSWSYGYSFHLYIICITQLINILCLNNRISCLMFSHDLLTTCKAAIFRSISMEHVDSNKTEVARLS